MAQARPIPYVVNGVGATIAQRPYQAAVLDIRRGPGRENQLHCGGVVVAPTLVLTAGHCTFDATSGLCCFLTDPNNLRVLVNTDTLNVGGTVVSVANIIRHPGYDPRFSLSNDLALLVLAQPVSARPIEIVPSHSDFRFAGGAPNATVSGWGCVVAISTCNDPAMYPVALRSANLVIHPQSACVSYFQSARASFDPATMICAGDINLAGRAASACYGDSGGPLTIPGPNGALLVGLVSWGLACGATPSGYVRVASFRNWLVSNGVPLQSAPFSGMAGPAIARGATPVAGDFNGDGFGDVLSYVPGTPVDHIFRGSPTGLTVPGPTMRINRTYQPLACDINRDGRTDLEMYAPGPSPDAALAGAVSPGSFASLRTTNLIRNAIAVAGDFNGDGFCDLLTYEPGRGPELLWRGRGNGTFQAVAHFTVNSLYLPFVGDFNGDGKADIFWYSPSHNSIWLGASSHSFTTISTPAMRMASVPIPGDFNGDGKTDILWYAPGAPSDALWYSTGTSFVRTNDVNINGTYRATSGDFNGDGKADILWSSPLRSGSSVWLGN